MVYDLRLVTKFFTAKRAKSAKMFNVESLKVAGSLKLNLQHHRLPYSPNIVVRALRYAALRLLRTL